MTDLLIRGALVTTSLVHQASTEGKGKMMKTFIPGIKAPVPFISANSIRGLIRRAAAEVLIESLIDRGQTISRGAYLSLVRGAHARTGINTGSLTFAQAQAAAEHVFAGVFGGGSFMFPSRMDIERDALPITIETNPLLPRDVHHLCIEEEAGLLMTRTMMAPRDDFAKLPDLARRVVKNVDAEYANHMQNKLAQSSASKAAKDANEDKVSKDDLDNFMGEIECIKPGVPLYFGLVGRGLTDEQVGLVLLGVQRWANRNVLGGGSARGRGRFKPDLTCTVDDEQIPLFEAIGDVPNLKLNPALDGLVSAALAAIAEQTPESIDEVYPVNIPDATDAPEKSAGTKTTKKAGRAASGKAA